MNLQYCFLYTAILETELLAVAKFLTAGVSPLGTLPPIHPKGRAPGMEHNLQQTNAADLCQVDQAATFLMNP